MKPPLFIKNIIMANRIKKDTLFTITGVIVAIAAFIGATVAVSQMVTKKNTSETVSLGFFTTSPFFPAKAL